VYDNEYSVIIVLIFFIIIIYIIFSNKNNRKYKVYKTNHYDIEKSIDIKSNDISESKKNISISISDNNKNNKNILSEESIVLPKKQKQMSLSLGTNEENVFIVINSIAKKYYSVKDIHNFMDKKNIFLNNSGYFNKHHVEKHTRCIKYSITNISNPGYLDKDKVGSPRIKGLMYFIQLPINTDPIVALTEMIADAREFSKIYDGDLCDSERVPLSNKTIKTLKKNIENYKYEH
tara:strand:- start:3668 stop:4366 length:699 start_codon:yes stop_codon:yes gene_type:complete